MQQPKVLLTTNERCKSRSPRDSLVNWKSCLPFVDNPRGVLIHRIREVYTFMTDGQPRHSHAEYWCGNGTNFDGGNIFTSSPGADRILCSRCEAIAVEHGQPTADELAGHHVHIGGVRPYRTCCKDKELTS